MPPIDDPLARLKGRAVLFRLLSEYSKEQQRRSTNYQPKIGGEHLGKLNKSIYFPTPLSLSLSLHFTPYASSLTLKTTSPSRHRFVHSFRVGPCSGWS